MDDPSGSIQLTGLPASYTVGDLLEFTVDIEQDGTEGTRHRWGFEMTALDCSNHFVGSLEPVDDVNTQRVDGQIGEDFRSYLTHTSTGTYFDELGAESASWTVLWVAPEKDAGPVTFYVAGNAANGDGTPAGDFIFTARSTVGGSCEPKPDQMASQPPNLRSLLTIVAPSVSRSRAIGGWASRSDYRASRAAHSAASGG